MKRTRIGSWISNLLVWQPSPLGDPILSMDCMNLNCPVCSYSIPNLNPYLYISASFDDF